MKLSYRTENNAKAIAAIWGREIDNKSPYTIKALSDDSTEIWIMDVLGYPWNDINSMIREVSSLKSKDILVRINSPGGDPIDTFALYHALKNHSAKVTVRIESLAASAASFLALAGDEVQAYSSSLFMIHNSWAVVAGNRFELQDIADFLEKIDANMQDVYASKTKLGKREIADMMKAETWLSAKEAKNKGFIDTIIDGKGVKAEFDLSIFANYPSNISDDPDNPTILTSFDVERILRDAKAPKAFAKAVAAACRTAGLFDRCQADDKPNGNDDKVIDNKPNAISNLSEITSLLNGAISNLNK
jgi:ATP-dependent protease ClpP protease subunit